MSGQSRTPNIREMVTGMGLAYMGRKTTAFYACIGEFLIRILIGLSLDSLVIALKDNKLGFVDITGKDG
ncbi:MAG: hypothetical protein EZS28_050214, partial [Streblomastix strix]